MIESVKPKIVRSEIKSEAENERLRGDWERAGGKARRWTVPPPPGVAA